MGRSRVVVLHLVVSHVVVGLMAFQAGFSVRQQMCFQQQQQGTDRPSPTKTSSDLVLEEEKLDQTERGHSRPTRQPASGTFGSSFPETVNRIFHSAAFVDRDDFVRTLDAGFPVDPTAPGNEQAMILYPSRQSAPSNVSTAEQALAGCGALRLVRVQPGGEPDACLAVLGQWENHNVHQFLR